ncbi:ABC transporter permease [Paenibacillus sp. URB8-2]|uniref:ABC transporter permease n=1 Tax=Paenibacillus sp. URB8-2 TaxID=2741301 RepID=UPI0015C13BB0|nr:ABC-2 family transporter protein [Paenibacillus sp. URB8-2]BCG58572.1 ABC transporter permease [Paenibacillus sp. URB8-2]
MIGRHIKLYIAMQSANLRSHMAYPLNFAIGVLSITFLGLSFILVSWVITQKVPVINGWGTYELIFMTSLWRTTHGIFIAFFVQSWFLDSLIRNGEFDRFLVRPLNPMFSFAAFNIQIYGFGDMLAGLIGLAVSMAHIPDWTFLKIAYLLVIVLCGAAIEWSLQMLIGCMVFWTLQGGAMRHILDQLLAQFTRYPLSIYNRVLQVLLTFVLPVAFISYYPSSFLLGNRTDGGFSPLLIYFTPLVALLLVSVTYFVWTKGINAYKGAGT